MQYDIEESGLSVTMTAANFDVAVTESAPLEVAVGECARIDVGEAVNYIESGRAEIGAAVDIGVNRIASSVNDGISDFNLNALNKTNAFNQNAGDKTYVFDNNASDKTTAFNNNATSKTGDFNTNATNKTNAFNQNATDKTDAFNLNATNKTTDFNDNYTAKKALIDAEVGNAAASATAADNSAKEAKQWAIGDPSEPTGNSAKYWANQAASSLSGLESRVTTIEGDIPAQASSSNQLADKNFVNSSIATNTANFIGTFNSVAALEAYSGTLTNNDYAFVVATDSAGNTVYNRYKWNGTAWLFEYALNNSSFTANQWAAINSGATTANIGQIATNTTAIATKADDNAVVHKTGGETITGQKNFKNDILIKGSTSLDMANTPSSRVSSEIEWQDKNNNNWGVDYLAHYTTGVKERGMSLYNGSQWNQIAIGVNESNNFYTYAPTPATSDTGTQIATTAFVKNVLAALYPVGSIYIGTQSTCPLATLISGSTWVKVSEGRVLQGSDSGHSAGTTIEAGLPNITGQFGRFPYNVGANQSYTSSSGVLYYTRDSNINEVINENSTSKNTSGYINFDASRSSAIYGNSSTVQPPVYVVNIWQRTA